jgi:hypothetical protein
VGLEHLPKERFFRVDGLGLPGDPANELLLGQLGAKLGLSIVLKEVTTEFLLIRNLTHPMPASWSHAPGAGLGGMEEIDPVDHLVVAPSVDMIGFVSFLTEHTTRPIWNQTSLGGKYQFSFILKGPDVELLLKEMGFDIITARRTLKCVVISPPGR